MNKKNAEDDAAKAIDEAQQRRSVEEAMEEAEREMAEMNAIKEKLAKKDASQNANASVSSPTNNRCCCFVDFVQESRAKAEEEESVQLRLRGRG